MDLDEVGTAVLSALALKKFMNAAPRYLALAIQHCDDGHYRARFKLDSEFGSIDMKVVIEEQEVSDVSLSRTLIHLIQEGI